MSDEIVRDAPNNHPAVDEYLVQRICEVLRRDEAFITSVASKLYDRVIQADLQRISDAVSDLVVNRINNERNQGRPAAHKLQFFAAIMGIIAICIFFFQCVMVYWNAPDDAMEINGAAFLLLLVSFFILLGITWALAYIGDVIRELAISWPHALAATMIIFFATHTMSYATNLYFAYTSVVHNFSGS